MNLIDLIALLFIISGVVFCLVAALGIVVLPDIFLRMSATTKAATMGAGLTLIGAALFFQDFAITTRAIAISLFLILTAPVGAHMIGRAAYFEVTEDGEPPLSDITVKDELKDRYDAVTRQIYSRAQIKKNDTSMRETSLDALNSYVEKQESK